MRGNLLVELLCNFMRLRRAVKTECHSFGFQRRRIGCIYRWNTYRKEAEGGVLALSGFVTNGDQKER